MNLYKQNRSPFLASLNLIGRYFQEVGDLCDLIGVHGFDLCFIWYTTYSKLYSFIGQPFIKSFSKLAQLA